MPTCAGCAGLPEGCGTAVSHCLARRGLRINLSQGVWAVQLCKHPTWLCWEIRLQFGISASKATHIQLWVLEAGNNGRSCQGELRRRHSGAGQGTKLKVVHKTDNIVKR